MVALIAYLFIGEDYSDIYQLCRHRGEEFKPLLKLPNGCPSEDTFERVMQAVHSDEISACLEVYTSQIIKDLSGLHIACVPKLLDKLALEGAVVTMDAMGTQVEIAEQNVKKKGDFVLALKGNQRHLFEDATDAFSTRQLHKRHLEQVKGHGRIDKRS